MQRIALLAGVTDGGAQADGKIVCACFSVSEAAHPRRDRKNGLTIPAEIGKPCSRPAPIAAPASQNSRNCWARLRPRRRPEWERWQA